MLILQENVPKKISEFVLQMDNAVDEFRMLFITKSIATLSNLIYDLLSILTWNIPHTRNREYY
jgi:hypothetical protein